MRIAVINLQSGIGTTKGYGQYATSGWKYVLPHGAKYVREAGALVAAEDIDIALITEVDDRGLRSGFLPQSETLSEYSGIPHTRFFPTRTIAPLVVEGNTILSRYPITHTETHPLSIGTIPRVMGEIIVHVEEQRVHVFVAHLGIRNIARAKQIQDIHRIITERDEPVILGGDFNERDHEAFEILRTAGFAHIVALPTFPSWKPVHSLSVLFLSDHFHAPTSSIPDAASFSDHLPLLAETSFR